MKECRYTNAIVDAESDCSSIGAATCERKYSLVGVDDSNFVIALVTYIYHTQGVHGDTNGKTK